jgi:hypothetical protein
MLSPWLKQKDEHINSLDMVNFKDNFESAIKKWKKNINIYDGSLPKHHRSQ